MTPENRPTLLTYLVTALLLIALGLAFVAVLTAPSPGHRCDPNTALPWLRCEDAQ